MRCGCGLAWPSIVPEIVGASPPVGPVGVGRPEAALKPSSRDSKASFVWEVQPFLRAPCGPVRGLDALLPSTLGS